LLRNIVAKNIGCYGKCLLRRMAAKKGGYYEKRLIESGCNGKWLLRNMFTKDIGC